MKRAKSNKMKIAAGAAAVLACGAPAFGQSVDALLDKLVDKGVLTTKEANELKEETDKNFTTAFQAKTGMPDWVTSFKWSGDFRGRYEGFYSPNPVWIDQERWRYRLRFGAVATLLDNFEVGLRLASGNVDNASGLRAGVDPISQNQTLQNNGSKKGIFLDLAYAKWTPLISRSWLGSVTIGKMENPFVVSDMLFDNDYTPEGAAAQLNYAINDRHSLKLIGGAFVVDNNASTVSPQLDPTYNPYMLGGQLLLDSTWNKRISTSVGFAVLGITHGSALVNGAVPNINQGNTRDLITTAPVDSFSPIVASAYATYTLDSFPLYTGAFPIKFGGEYMYNGAAPYNAGNHAYNVGVTVGKAGKRSTWELAYTWKWLGANSWYEEFTDSDYGALYVVTQPASGFNGPNYGSGTNVKGNILKLSYSPYDFLTLSGKWFNTWLIRGYPTGSDSAMNRIQVDATFKF